MTAEEFFNENAIWNGTVISNPIQLMEAYHKHRVNSIDRKFLDYMLESEEKAGALWFKNQLLK